MENESLKHGIEFSQWPFSSSTTRAI